MNFPLEILENIFIYADNITDVRSFLIAFNFNDRSIMKIEEGFDSIVGKRIDNTERYNSSVIRYGRPYGGQVRWIDSGVIEYYVEYNGISSKKYIANVDIHNCGFDNIKHTIVVHEDSKGNVWLIIVINYTEGHNVITFKNGVTHALCTKSSVIHYGPKIAYSSLGKNVYDWMEMVKIAMEDY